MANAVYLDLTGLQRYDAKLKNVAGGSLSIDGRTITLLAIDGTALGTIDVPQTVYSLATGSTDGLMSAAQFTKLEGVSEGATKTEATGTNGKLKIDGTEIDVYIHPSGAALASGMYKITTDASGHVTVGEAVSKADITALGIPAQDTTYSLATSAADGLMSAADFTKLEGVAEGATKTQNSGTNGNIVINGQEVAVYTHDTNTAYASGLYKVTVDDKGHVTAATAVSKADITALGVPAENTTYDLATADKEGLMSASHYTKVEGVEAGAQVNVLEKVSVNGAELTVNSKGVNIDLSGYALKADLAAVYEYKGSVDTYAELPSDAEVGDVYNIAQADSANGINAGDNVAWNGTEWDNFAGAFVMSSISSDEIDALFA